MERTFKIDFFELMFLTEACIPPTPIARAAFWESMINVHYNTMSENQRKRVFDWINRNSYYQEQLEKGNEDVLLFQNRYNPDNQYRVYYDFKGEVGHIDTFLHNGEYRMAKNNFVRREYIIKIEKLGTDGKEI